MLTSPVAVAVVTTKMRTIAERRGAGAELTDAAVEAANDAYARGACIADALNEGLHLIQSVHGLYGHRRADDRAADISRALALLPSFRADPVAAAIFWGGMALFGAMLTWGVGAC